ncbi:MAG: ankyrin repeat domain-containing protein [Pseudomonadota bacterium]|nr:ankyrin repeat domain-containing protein [Pseudomonadota bacterium]
MPAEEVIRRFENTPEKEGQIREKIADLAKRAASQPDRTAALTFLARELAPSSSGWSDAERQELTRELTRRTDSIFPAASALPTPPAERPSQDVLNAPLINIARFGSVEQLEKALEGVSVNARDGHGHTALHYAAREGKTELVDLLLRRGADPNIKNVFSDTPLHEAATSGKPAVVRRLLEDARTDIRIKNRENRTALDIVRTYRTDLAAPERIAPILEEAERNRPAAPAATAPTSAARPSAPVAPSAASLEQAMLEYLDPRQSWPDPADAKKLRQGFHLRQAMSMYARPWGLGLLYGQFLEENARGAPAADITQRVTGNPAENEFRNRIAELARQAAAKPDRAAAMAFITEELTSHRDARRIPLTPAQVQQVGQELRQIVDRFSPASAVSAPGRSAVAPASAPVPVAAPLRPAPPAVTVPPSPAPNADRGFMSSNANILASVGTFLLSALTLGTFAHGMGIGGILTAGLGLAGVAALASMASTRTGLFASSAAANSPPRQAAADLALARDSAALQNALQNGYTYVSPSPDTNPNRHLPFGQPASGRHAQV